MKIRRINDDEIEFDNGYTLSYYHSQDCCENVYADFSILKHYNLSITTGKVISVYDLDFYEKMNKLITGVEAMGFTLNAKNGDKFFVPCYNEQNGYYSSNLELNLSKLDTENMDISNCVKDEID